MSGLALALFVADSPVPSLFASFPIFAGVRMPNEPSEPSDSKRATLFLSYSHADDAKARRIATLLEEAGYTVWWDALIEGGAAYARSIGSALETADAVIVMWSAHSVESDWVRDEAAQGRDRQCLIPISLDGARPPLGFRQYQVIKFRSWRGRRDSWGCIFSIQSHACR